jgi:hypothetical protein
MFATARIDCVIHKVCEHCKTQPHAERLCDIGFVYGRGLHRSAENAQRQ